MATSTCSVCGRAIDIHHTDVAFRHPDAYLAVPEEERADRVWGDDDPNMRAVDGRCYIRGTLPIRVQRKETPFAWGVWAEVSEQRLKYYWEHFREDLTAHPPFAGRLATNIPDYPGGTLLLDLSIQFMDADTRPVFTVTDLTHPLGVQQRDGVDWRWFEQIAHRYAR